MGDTTGIAWTDHTFNIAWGCEKVSPGCKHCYADTLSSVYGNGLTLWGPGSTRRTFGAKHWNDPIRWNRAALAAGTPTRAFSSSMCDWAEDHPIIAAERSKLWPLIRATPHVHWQLLTKRAETLAACLPDDWGDGYPNVWLGVSVENQKYADERLPHLIRIPAVVRFVSYEPALGPVTFIEYLDRLDWIIYGGESGPGFRAEDKQWARDSMAECREFGVAFFHKQSAAPRTEMGIELDGHIVREFPVPRHAVSNSRLTVKSEVAP